jgi:hypothetical protein
VSSRAIRKAVRLASVAVRVNSQRASPKRRVSSSPTHAASSVGSIVVIPRDACKASSTGAGAWPAIAPVSPRQRSMYSCPSTSTTRLPEASATATG